jgi:uncharacterized protein
MSIENLIILSIAGFFAGFVDSIAGGGGLISLPALLSVGLPPQIALGTNKLQGTFGVFTAAINFIRKGKVDLSECKLGVLTTFFGALSGALLIQHLNPDTIGRIVPFLLLLVLVYTFFSKNLGIGDSSPKMPRVVFYLLFGLGLGFYDGFFGPGTGSFWTVALLVLLGHNMTRSIGVTKVMNFTSNVVALGVFVMSDSVYYTAGIVMAVGQVFGSRLGSGLAIKRGVSIIRPLFMLVVFFTILRLIYMNYFV